MSHMRNIYIAEYDPLWIDKFNEEAKKLKPIFGDLRIQIHHIGSTSIPNMPAKPIIDIMPIVTDIHKVDFLNAELLTLGYEAKGENNIPGRRYFRKGGNLHRSHHLHVYELNNIEVNKHLDFRDYLIAHPKIATAYAELKRTVAAAHPHDIFGYMDGKHAFIRETITKAKAWRIATQDMSSA